jgi:hypothetical protein
MQVGGPGGPGDPGPGGPGERQGEGRDVARPEQQVVSSIIPLDMGLFSTTSVLAAMVIRQPVPSFIRDMFFPMVDYSNSDWVQMDVKRGGKTLAPFVLPLEGQVIGRRIPYLRTMISAPTIAPARVITLRDAIYPGFGETQYNFSSPEQRVANMFAEDSLDMDEEIARTEEWMCCQVMFTGKFAYNVRNKTPITVDYNFTNITAVPKPWTDPTSDPLGDLQLAQQGLNANGYSGNVAIYSPAAFQALWNNPKVKDLMKNTIGFVPISGYTMPQATAVGVQKAPSFMWPTMENWIYSATYQAAGAAIPYIPDGSVLIGSSDVRNRLIYALVVQIEQSDGEFHSYSSDRVPKVECNVNKNLYMYTITSRPVPMPQDLLSWTILEGVV